MSAATRERRTTKSQAGRQPLFSTRDFETSSKAFRTTLFSLCIYAFLTLTCTRAPLPCYAAVEIHPNAGTTSATFLKLGIGSRATGMGGAFAGLADDSTAIYWNPAGLAQLTRAEIHLTHNESFEATRHDFIGYAYPLRHGTIAAAIYGFYTPDDIERRSGLFENDPYEPLSPLEGYFQSYDIAAHICYSRQFSHTLSLGAGVKIIQQTIDDHNAFGAGMDIGALYRTRTLPLSLGLVAQHIGTPMRFSEQGYHLPFNLRLGAAWRWNKKLVTTLDCNKPVDNFVSFAAGAEYSPIELISLRIGYRYRWHGLELGDLSGLSSGMGFTFPLAPLNCRLDYAFTPFGILGNSHRFSLNILFDTPRKTEENARTVTTISGKKRVVTVTDPSLPAEPAFSRPSAVYDDYAFFPATTSTRIKMATGRMAVYSLNAEFALGDLVSLSGDAKLGRRREITLEAGEMKGTGRVYKHFAFRKDFSTPLSRVKGVLRIPRQIVRPVINTGDKTITPLELFSQDDSHCSYRFTLDFLKPFTIEEGAP